MNAALRFISRCLCANLFPVFLPVREILQSFQSLEQGLSPAYFVSMKYPVILIPSEEGFAVGCPSLPGCWSQGKTQVEALTNIREAIQLWLEVEAEEDGIKRVEEDLVTV